MILFDLFRPPLAPLVNAPCACKYRPCAHQVENFVSAKWHEQHVKKSAPPLRTKPRYAQEDHKQIMAHDTAAKAPVVILFFVDPVPCAQQAAKRHDKHPICGTKDRLIFQLGHPLQIRASAAIGCPARQDALSGLIARTN